MKPTTVNVYIPQTLFSFVQPYVTESCPSLSVARVLVRGWVCLLREKRPTLLPPGEYFIGVNNLLLKYTTGYVSITTSSPR